MLLKFQSREGRKNYHFNMAKEEKKPTERKKRGKYDDKLHVKGSFLDLMKAAGKDAKSHNAPAKPDTEKKP